MEVFVLGSTGMLGRYVTKYLEENNFVTHMISRDDMDISKVDEKEIEDILELKEGDVVINCAGTIKPRVDELGELNALLVNSVFPHRLNNVCKKTRAHMIHITTDCVFSGKKGDYIESDEHDVTDIYGRTKSLGEPDDSTIIRTSIIGEEKGQTRSLVEWIKSMEGEEVNGFTNHRWNGVTCLQLSKIIVEIINKGLWWSGVRHIHSPSWVDKAELVNMVNNTYNLNITVHPKDADEKVDRTLQSIYIDEIHHFDVPDLKEQIKELQEYKL